MIKNWNWENKLKNFSEVLSLIGTEIKDHFLSDNELISLD